MRLLVFTSSTVLTIDDVVGRQLIGILRLLKNELVTRLASLFPYLIKNHKVFPTAPIEQNGFGTLGPILLHFCSHAAGARRDAVVLVLVRRYREYCRGGAPSVYQSINQRKRVDLCSVTKHWSSTPRYTDKIMGQNSTTAAH